MSYVFVWSLALPLGLDPYETLQGHSAGRVRRPANFAQWGHPVIQLCKTSELNRFRWGDFILNHLFACCTICMSPICLLFHIWFTAIVNITGSIYSFTGSSADDPSWVSWEPTSGSPYLLSADGKGSVSCWDLSCATQCSKLLSRATGHHSCILQSSTNRKLVGKNKHKQMICCSLPSLKGVVCPSLCLTDLRPHLRSNDPLLSFDAHDKGISQAPLLTANSIRRLPRAPRCCSCEAPVFPKFWRTWPQSFPINVFDFRC